MPRQKQTKVAQNVSELAVGIAMSSAQALQTAERLGVKTKLMKTFTLDDKHRATIAALTTVDSKIRKRLGQKQTKFTVAEAGGMVLAIAEAIIDAEPKAQLSQITAANKLIECLAATLLPPTTLTKEKKPFTATHFQFKITLIDIRPAIWRRIQVPDCTLADFHEYIQAAFGWENYHMHHFEINKKRYSTPSPYDDDLHCEDESKVTLSEMLPLKTKKKIRWLYEYDFGDGWRHEILFEGNPPIDPKLKAPVCLEGERACPPEDCGGPWGYDDFLAALSNRKDPRHEEIVEWIGEFDPEAFDAKAATIEMRRVK